MADLQTFLRDTRNHETTILLDDGVHRNLRIGRPCSSNHLYYLTTWPGHLCISGDMGTYVFARTMDMFRFFRDDQLENRINPSYWHEKLQSADKHNSPKEFDQDRFKKVVLEAADEFQVRLGDADQIKKDIQRNILDFHPYTESEAYSLVHEFEASDGSAFCDFDYDLTKWSYHFIWCLRAIVWGIKQYDLITQDRTQAGHDRKVLTGLI